MVQLSEQVGRTPSICSLGTDPSVSSRVSRTRPSRVAMLRGVCCSVRPSKPQTGDTGGLSGRERAVSFAGAFDQLDVHRGRHQRVHAGRRAQRLDLHRAQHDRDTAHAAKRRAELSHSVLIDTRTDGKPGAGAGLSKGWNSPAALKGRPLMSLLDTYERKARLTPGSLRSSP